MPARGVMLLSGKKCAEASKEGLYRDYCQRFPQMKGGMAVPCTFAAVQLCAAAIEEAGSVDRDEVMKILDDPNWRFEWFGRPGASLGGTELVGINRCINDEVGYSELINCEKVMKSRKTVDIP